MIKFTSPGRWGVSDRILILPRAPAVFVELKKPGGTVARKQNRFRMWLNSVGHRAYVFDNVEAFKELCKELTS